MMSLVVAVVVPQISPNLSAEVALGRLRPGGRANLVAALSGCLRRLYRLLVRACPIAIKVVINDNAGGINPFGLLLPLKVQLYPPVWILCLLVVLAPLLPRAVLLSLLALGSILCLPPPLGTSLFLAAALPLALLLPRRHGPLRRQRPLLAAPLGRGGRRRGRLRGAGGRCPFPGPARRGLRRAVLGLGGVGAAAAGRLLVGLLVSGDVVVGHDRASAAGLELLLRE
mmetsp:Transcript_21985/g.62419  ORF Transcript_21985/g.62419 Transcript_21985/m.62419 type:complete len:227 (-) Transcript_21985:330-1010(-)